MTKPSRFGEGFGKTARYGRGQQIRDFPTDVPITYADFSGGYNSSKGREGAPPNSSPDSIDFEVNRHNRLVRMAGTADPTNLAGRKAMQMVTQASLDGRFELVMFDAPYLGVMDNTGINWTNVGLIASDRPYAIGQYADVLIFGNRAGPVFTREPHKAPVATPSIPGGVSYATFATRVYVGGAVIDGSYAPMGIAWSDVTGDPTSFDELKGAGNQLLISDFSDGEAVVAVRAMNLDFIAAICTGSVWVGRRTGDTFQPAAFEPRAVGNGGLTDRTVASTPLGVAFLSLNGLQIFDGNSINMISAAINAELLPLDLSKIDQYRVTYNPAKNRIEILTPTCSWVFDIEFSRWYRSSLVASDVAFYAPDVGGTTWAQLQGFGTTWAQLSTQPWLDLNAKANGAPERYYLKYSTDVISQFAKEAGGVTKQFGITMTPRWQTSRQLGKEILSLQTVKSFEMEYLGDGTIELWLPGREGQSELAWTQQLNRSTTLRSKKIPFYHTGRGTDLEIRATAGLPEISLMQLVVEARSTLIVAIEAPDAPPPPPPPTYDVPPVNGITRLSKGVIVSDFQAALNNVIRTTQHIIPVPGAANLTDAYLQGVANDPYNHETFSGLGLYQNGISVMRLLDYFGPSDVNAGYDGLGGGNNLVVGRGNTTHKMEYYQGHVRAWSNNLLLQDAVVAIDPTRIMYAAAYIEGDGNPDSGPTGNKSGSVDMLVCKRFDLVIQNTYPNGSVSVKIGTAAPFTKNLDGTGGGIVAVPAATLWPQSVTFDFYGAPNLGGAWKGQLIVPDTYGGDVIGHI